MSINKIRKMKVKSELLKGSTAKDATLKAGYSRASAHNATKLGVVKHCQDEIMKELLEADVTVELIITRINQDRNLARSKGDTSTMLQCDIALGKYLSMFTDKTEISNKNPDTIVIVDKTVNKRRLNGVE